MNTRKRLRILTVIGTRPEIIRLAPTLKRLDRYSDHVLVHTGQNYDYELNEIFFEDLTLRKPDHFLGADTSSLGTVLGTILIRLEQVLLKEQPDAMLVLGDTNSSISAVIAKRLKIPVFHMEAGNRSFDENVPEETNRRMVDHVADYNLVYTEHARRNLLMEGIHPSRIMLTGSPMREVLEANLDAIEGSRILDTQGLRSGEFFLVSLHREETVSNAERLRNVLVGLNAISEQYGLTVLVSTHPRTRRQLEEQDPALKSRLTFHTPYGFHDYIKLQKEAKLVLSDSGTISEEASILGFPAVTLRDFIERPEALDGGNIITTGVQVPSILDAVDMALQQAEESSPAPPPEYLITNTSQRVVNFIRSTAHSHYQRTGIRTQKTCG